MAGWADLPNHLIAHIANYIKVIEDFIAFRAVCTSFRIAVTEEDFDVRSPQVPLLMLGAKDEDHREFYTLSKKKVSRIFIPEARRSECVPSDGWLCTMVNDTGEMNLIHPFSRKKIQLPSRKHILTFHGTLDFERSNGGNRWFFLDRAVLSANPSFTSDYVLMVHHFLPSCLAIWRPGDLDWTHIDFHHDGEIVALIYHRGLYYSITLNGQVRSYRVSHTDVQTRLIVEMDQHQVNLINVKYYLVELSGALLLVTRFFNNTYDDPNGNYHTFKFKVSELTRLMRGEWEEEVKSLGDSSIFLGRNGATCIDSRKFEGIKSNHIYFTDDGLELLDEGGAAGRDMGTYNLEDGKFESFYPGQSTSLICPPVWVMPSLM